MSARQNASKYHLQPLKATITVTRICLKFLTNFRSYIPTEIKLMSDAYIQIYRELKAVLKEAYNADNEVWLPEVARTPWNQFFGNLCRTAIRY